jgi:hypothetical protein
MHQTPPPDPKLLRELLDYDPQTGQLLWKARPLEMFANNVRIANGWNARWAGKPAFTASDRKGYRIGAINAQGHLAHRVIWAWATGAWPEPGLEVDHINGQPADNRLMNLRLVTQSQQMWNRKDVTRPIHDLPRGVRRRSDRVTGKCYKAHIWLHGKDICLGYFTTPEAAEEAYLKAVAELHGDHSFYKSRT